MARITNQWTPTLEGAYGEVGKEARNAELFVKEAIESWGWLVKDNESSYSDQVSGKDLLIKNPSWKNYYSVDVKNNMNEYGCFFVDSSLNGWLFKKTKTSDRIWHVNTKTGWMAWYGRNEMREYIVNNSLTETGLVKITPSMKIPFVTRRKYEKAKVYLGDISA